MRKPKPVNVLDKLLADSDKIIKMIDAHIDVIYGIKNRLDLLEKKAVKSVKTEGRDS